MMLISYKFSHLGTILIPDKNANDPEAAVMLKEITFSYYMLSNLDKRCQYDNAGFKVCTLEYFSI